MTRLVLDIPNIRDLEVLLPLLRRLRIRYARVETPEISPEERVAAIQVIEQGCDMTAFGDSVDYQRSVREDRVLPYETRVFC